MTFLKRSSEAGVFAWVTLSSDCRFELQVACNESEPVDRQCEFRKSPLFDGILNICSRRKIHLNKKNLKRCFSQFEAITFV